MAYQALYRKWRPMVFDHVIGQKHVTKTLKNELMSQRISHAYLFTGIRGTGKTSVAKIFSRAINCQNNNDGNPCNQCDICKGIIDGSILDVIEIDAASNNGVDNIREIREEVVYTAAQTKYKVYIIDEVHMLSTGAFNALLKTLEEPPSHVIFILATTEVHKLPATILSRCQRFDFRRITTNDVVEALADIAKKEGVTIDNEGLLLIANLAEGSMRDALSIMDRCFAFGDKDINYADIIEVLGVADSAITSGIAKSIAEGSFKGAIELISEALSEGKGVTRICEALIKLFRDLMLCKVVDKPNEILDLTPSQLEDCRLLSESFSQEKLINCINVLSEAHSTMKYMENPRIPFELAIVKLASPSLDYTMGALMQRIADLEGKIANGVPAALKYTEKLPEPPKREMREKAQQKPIISDAPKEAFSSEIGDYATLWSKLILEVKNQGNRSLYGFLSDTRIKGQNSELKIITNDELALSYIKKENNINIITEVFEKLSGIKPNIRVINEENEDSQTNDTAFEKLKKDFEGRIDIIDQ